MDLFSFAVFCFFFKQKTAYELRISDWSSDVCSSDLEPSAGGQFYANYSRSVEFPGFIELGQVAAFVPLDAQRAWTAEAGTRGRSGPLSWDVTYYRSTIKGEVLQFVIGTTLPASTFIAGRPLHRAEERRVGKECGGKCIFGWSQRP